MATKSEIKSKIPIIRKESRITTKVCYKDPSKPEEKLKPKTTKTGCVEHKTAGEVQQCKGKIKKVALIEKNVCTGKSLKPNPSSRTADPLKLNYISKEMGKLLKAEKLQDSKESVKVGQSHNVLSITYRCTDGEPSSDIVTIKDKSPQNTETKEKKETTRSAMVLPKKYCPHSGIILKSNPIKSSAVRTSCFNPNRKPKPLQRSKTECDPDNDSTGAVSNLLTQEKTQSNERKVSTILETEALKSPVLSENRKFPVMNKNELHKEIQIHSKKPPAPLSRPNRNPVDNKTVKPPDLKFKTLRRSRTMHAFDSASISKISRVPDFHSLKEKLTLKTSKVKAQSENEDPGTPKLAVPQSDGDFEEVPVTPKKELPHSGLIFKVQGPKRNNVKTFGTFAGK